MSTRTVTYKILRPDGSAWAKARLKFELSPGSFDDDASFPGSIVADVADENGEGSVTLWANEGGDESSEYIVTFPNGETDRFTLPEGAADIDLSALRLLGVSQAQGSTLITYILAQWHGAWDEDTAYSKGDKVSHEGSSYIATADTTAGQEPGVHASWGLIAQKGDTGAKGATGAANDTYDIALTVIGRPGGSEVVGRFVAVRAFTLAEGLTGSQGVAGTAATAEAELSVQKDGVEIGTLTFAAAGTTATPASAEGASFAGGDVLTVVAPATPDATLADLAIVLKGATV